MAGWMRDGDERPMTYTKNIVSTSQVTTYIYTYLHILIPFNGNGDDQPPSWLVGLAVSTFLV